MNIIFILVDSLNKEALRTYNPDTVCETPNIEKFANRSHVFDNHYVGSLPCMPARREIFSGRKEFMWRPWGPLEVFDPRLPREIEKQGYNTGMITDHYHYWEETANGYVQGFMSAELIRGHETDFHTLRDNNCKDAPGWIEKTIEYRAAEHMYQYWENVKDFKDENDFFSAKTFKGAADWLEKYADRGKFFLTVETFDVHEPFHVPEPYASMYTEGIEGDGSDHNIWPPYQMYDDLAEYLDNATPEDIAYLRSQYYGKTTMVDKWIGHLLDTIERLGLMDDTMIVFTTDHGHDLGEHNKLGKQFPHYDSHANIPMIVWHPKNPGNGRRVSHLSQTVDVFSTLIEASGGTPPDSTRHSISMLPVVLEDTPIRDALTYGTFGQGVCVTDGTWTLFKAPVEGEPLFAYSTMITRPLIVDNPVDGRVGAMPPPPVDQGYYDPSVPYPLWKLPITIDPRTYENFLFNREDDPNQDMNLWDRSPEERDRMLSILRKLLDDEGYPSEQMSRLGIQHVAPAA